MAVCLLLAALAQPALAQPPVMMTVGAPVELPPAGSLRLAQSGPVLPSPYYAPPGQISPPVVAPFETLPQPGTYVVPGDAGDPFAPGGQFDPYRPLGQSPVVSSGPILPDRPRQLPRPDVVGAGRWGLELGYRATDYGEGTTQFNGRDLELFDSFRENGGNALVRYGVADPVELRLGLELFDGDLSSPFIGDERFGSGAIDLGLKWNFSQADRWRPKSSLIGEVGYLSTEDDGTARGRVLLLNQWAIPPWLSGAAEPSVFVGLSGGIDFAGDSELTSSGTTGSLAASLEKRWRRATLFGELATVRGSRQTAQLGLLVPIGDHVVLDVAGGYAGFDEDFGPATGGIIGDVDFDGAFVTVGLSIVP